MRRANAAGLLLIGVAACAGRSANVPNGAVLVEVDPPIAARPVTSVVLDVAPDRIRVALERAPDGSFGGILVVPSGPHALTATAYAGADAVGTGTAAVPEPPRPPPVPDHGPVIVSLAASRALVRAGEEVRLAARAVDVDGDEISYAWTASCAASAFDGQGSRAVRFVPAAPGTCEVTLTVASRRSPAGPTLADTRAIEIAVSAARDERRASVEPAAAPAARTAP